MKRMIIGPINHILQIIFIIRESENQANLSEQVLMHQFTVNLTRQYIQLICEDCIE